MTLTNTNFATNTMFTEIFLTVDSLILFLNHKNYSLAFKLMATIFQLVS